ncbi:MAG: hypothetical protein ABR606_17895 [Vicinamibacterales bacterium]
MHRSRVSATLLIALLVAPLALLELACSRSSERQLLSQFFRAARARDNTTLAMMAAARFEPREQGTVEEFEIATVGPEQRTPINFKALLEAEDQARAREADFAKRKKVYQDANLAAIEQILKLERDPKAKISADQLKMKAEWDKWREDTGVHAKATAAARAAASAQTGIVEASLARPGQPPFQAAQFDGELRTKAVSVNAQVRSPEGQVAPKTMVVTLQRAVGKMNGQSREGRWIIARIDSA